MQTSARYLSVVFHILTYGSSFAAAFIFLFLPMQSVQRTFGVSIENAKLSFLLFAAITATGFSFLLQKFFVLVSQDWKRTGKFRPVANPPLPKWMTLAQIVLSFALMARVIYDIDLPFDNDELDGALRILDGDFGFFYKVLHTAAHPIGAWAAVLSTKLFGISIWSLRLPAVFFGMGFLYFFYFLSRKLLSPASIALVYLHFVCNAIVVWYFHSIRGYAPMMFLICFLTWKIVDAMTGHWKTRDWITVSTALLLLPFSHGFGTLFGIFLPFAFVAWVLFNEKTFSGEQFRFVSKVACFLLAFLPFTVGCLGIAFLTSVEGTQYMGAGDAVVANSNFPGALNLVLGGTHTVQLKILALVLLFAGALLAKQNRLQKNFLGWLLIFYLGFVFVQKELLKTYITGRFFLGVLPLLLIALLQCVDALRNSRVRSCAQGILVLALVVFPLLDSKPAIFQIPRDNYYAFLSDIRQLLKTVPRHCIAFSFSGKSPAAEEARIAENYYFPVKTSQDVCTQKYLAHFGWPWQDFAGYTDEDRRIATESDLPQDYSYKIVKTDGEGRFLALVTGQTTAGAKSAAISP